MQSVSIVTICLRIWLIKFCPTDKTGVLPKRFLRLPDSDLLHLDAAKMGFEIHQTDGINGW